MSVVHSRVLELAEYESISLPAGEFAAAEGEMLWREYGKQVAVEFPSPKTAGEWRLTAQGWVGFIPLTPELGLRLNPKVEIANLFRMWEYAYRLRDFHLLEGLTGAESIQDFFEQLASVLARRVLDRARQGFYRAYLRETDQLPYVRGRMDVLHSIRSPWETRLRCHYDEHTADIEDNQILAWTLSRIARGGQCSERVLPTVRRAYRTLQSTVALQPFSPAACTNRLYNRLNDDYQPLHALCRFFLEQSGPTHQAGDRRILPFLVDMAQLFELFVAAWLRTHLPPEFTLREQETVTIDPQGDIRFRIDMVLYDAATGDAVCVLDTKYKTASKPVADDVAQVVAYAEAKGCQTAVLIYPGLLANPSDIQVGGVQVRSMNFDLSGDLEQAGRLLLQQLALTTEPADA